MSPIPPPAVERRRPTTAELLERAHAASRTRFATLRGLGEIDGPPVAPEDGVRWLAETCVERTIDEFDAVVAVTGKEGVSKSMLALELCLEVARITRRPWAFDRLCYNARAVIANYASALSENTRSTTIWYDEGVRGLLAGETFEPDQVALSKNLMLNREVGAILIVCVPDIWDLARKVRGRRATFWVHVQKRGTRRKPAPSKARVHERDDSIPYKPRKGLGLAVSKRCPYLTYEPLSASNPILVEYQRVKKFNLGEFFRESMDDLDRAEAKRKR